MKVILPIYFLCGVVENFVGCLRGVNYAISPMIPCFLSVCVYRIVWVYTAFVKLPTTFMLYLSYPISWALNLAMIAALYMFVYQKDIRISKAMHQDRKTEVYIRV